MPEIKTNLIEVEFRPDADVASELENIINPGDFLKYAVKEQLTVAVEELKERNKPKFGQWVSVDDAVPTVSERVLVMFKLDGMEDYRVAFRGGDLKWYDHVIGSILTKPVTHWMPLPPDPQ